MRVENLASLVVKPRPGLTVCVTTLCGQGCTEVTLHDQATGEVQGPRVYRFTSWRQAVTDAAGGSRIEAALRRLLEYPLQCVVRNADRRLARAAVDRVPVRTVIERELARGGGVKLHEYMDVYSTAELHAELARRESRLRSED